MSTVALQRTKLTARCQSSWQLQQPAAAFFARTVSRRLKSGGTGSYGWNESKAIAIKSQGTRGRNEVGERARVGVFPPARKRNALGLLHCTAPVWAVFDAQV